ncbi:cytosolic carboxypeptidase 6 isoform X2 [Atheta coriaria]|uniref:cytosolic carboxypeptidase 6 isoform X2 n=1 Tax=Dalotia coriaria TaxID=877792 RepID=UPI0031F35E4B
MGDFGEDSDDSDGEGGMGNVNRLIMRPAGHSGKAKRGHLCFDASFETGNLGRVDLVNDYEYDLYVRPDTCCPKLRFWFNFTVDNVRLQQRVVFNIVNFSKARNLFNGDGLMVPIVRSTSRSKWQRIPKRMVFYQRSVAHKNQYVLSFAFVFDKEDEIYHFALTYPYGYNRAQAFLGQLETKCADLGEGFKRECIGNTIQKRPVDLLTIGNNSPITGTKRRIVVIIARTHPGQAPTSFVCQGMIELLISAHSIATKLREHILFKIIPMLNPDGVFVGNYRSTIIGADLNRMWHRASPFAHPALTAIIAHLTEYEKNKDYQIDFVIDIHAHASLLGSFIYGNSYDDVYRNERHILFPKLLGNMADDFDPRSCMYNSCPSKAGTARRYFCTAFNDKLNAYSYEVSMFGYKLKSSDAVIPYTEESYKRCGRNLLKALLEYYRVTEVIPLSLTQDVKEKSTRRVKKSRKTRPCNISSSRSHTQRVAAPVHYKEINMYYDSESSPEREDDRPLFRSKFGKKTRKNTSSGKNKTENVSRSSSPVLMVMPPTNEPCLTIIDFNIITENELKM